VEDREVAAALADEHVESAVAIDIAHVEHVRRFLGAMRLGILRDQPFPDAEVGHCAATCEHPV